MDEKSLKILEFSKVLQRLENYCAFSASAALVRALRPTNDLELALERLGRTTEARRLLSEHNEISIGGAHDIRPQVNLAERGGVLNGEELMDIKNTLVSARDLARTFEKFATVFPRLASIAAALPPPPGLIEAISRVLSDKGEVMDSASEKLANLRRELKSAYDHLMTKLERLINDPHTAAMLQEPIVTIRNGRYVVPVRAEYKSKFKGLTQDASSSGSTFFIEPLAIVELNNRWHEVQLAEQEEVRRILTELSALVGAQAAQIQGVVRSLAALDLAFACAKYADDLKAAEPILQPFPSAGATEVILRLNQARHPLLDQNTVVPIDVFMEKGTHALVITGPNTGGKTVTLKTMGILILMAQSGLHIPVQSGSHLCLFKDVFADIGDEQSIEQSLSTFSGHITNIVRILKRTNCQTLALLDELGAGTDPQEGSALARAILNFLVIRKAPCLIATHYPELKVYAHTTPGVVNASVEFDLNSLKPTYHLIIGLPGHSNALAIAQRLGLSEEIIKDARDLINPADLKAEDLLDEIHRQRNLTREEHTTAEALRKEIEQLQTDLEERLEKIEEERQLILSKAKDEAELELELVRQELNEARKQIRSLRTAPDTIKPLQEKLEKVEEKIARRPEKFQPSIREPRPLRIGDRIQLRSLKVDGVVTALKNFEVEVQVGKMRLRVSPSDLQRADHKGISPVSEIEESNSSCSSSRALPASPGVEIHLRGMRVDEAIPRLEQYLDSAYAAGLPFVRIVHGKGTGTLRQVVRQMLSESSLVKKWETAMDNEGGEGVTVAHLHTE